MGKYGEFVRRNQNVVSLGLAQPSDQRNMVESSHLDRVFAGEESMEQPMLLAPNVKLKNASTTRNLYTICTITKLRPGTGKCPHDQKISEVFLEEGEAGATRRANQIRILDAFSRQCFSNDGGSAQEDTNVLALVLVTVLLEDTTPIWPPKELACCAGEFLHLS